MFISSPALLRVCLSWAWFQLIVVFPLLLPVTSGAGPDLSLIRHLDSSDDSSSVKKTKGWKKGLQLHHDVSISFPDILESFESIRGVRFDLVLLMSDGDDLTEVLQHPPNILVRVICCTFIELYILKMSMLA